MKNIISLFTCMVVLDYTSAMLGRPKEHQLLPNTFPLDSPTYLFIQKKDGDVFFGYLNYNGRNIPEWIHDDEYDQNDAVEHAFVRMPNGENFISIVKRLGNRININDELPEEHRCFILYESFNILVADLLPVNRLQKVIIWLIGIAVRMPDEDNRFYKGTFKYYHGTLPSWLKAY